MSLSVCTSEYMLSNHRGTGMARSFFPRVVAEAFLESTKDGPISRSPDPVTMIDGDLTWHNGSRDAQTVAVQIHRAPRTIVSQSPGTVVIHDAYSQHIAANPRAEFPSIMIDAVGGAAQIDRASVAREEVKYCRFFLDTDDSVCWVPGGVVEPGQTLHFRYLAAVQTPGIWTQPSEFEPRWEAHARWTRLRAWAGPLGSS